MKRLIRKKQQLLRSQRNHGKQETPKFERLESRLLLNADITGLAAGQGAIAPLNTDQPDNVIDVNIVQSDTLTTTDALATVTPQAMPYSQDFSAGVLPGAAQGWEYYSNNSQGRIQVTGERLRMDDTTTDTTYSLNEAILHLDLTNKKDVTLTLDQTNLGDEVNGMAASFTGHFKGDGISLSIDGNTWITITSLQASFTGQSFNLDSFIELAKTAAGSTNVSDVRIKFQQYDNTTAPSDGREFDNIKVTAITVQQLPYNQDFSAGQPGAGQGWEYYSTNQGQIQVVGGRLRLDDSVQDTSYSLNEAILHLDLTGQTGIKLTLDQYTLTDEVSNIPLEFIGHYKGDGISISVDGVNWVRITSLSGSFTGLTFSIDPQLAEAKALAGSNDVSNVRIKFQQYDNTPAPDDGREFDNIHVTATYAAQTAPYSQDFSGSLPAGTQGWEYYSTSQGQIQVVGGRLRLDDSVSDSTYSSNEAILHVNLTGLKDITLTLDHFNLSDANSGIVESYSGHYKGDAISLSIDGINWIRITNLTTSFNGQVFDLDSMIEKAKLAAGSTDLSNVRIKFQQYGNNTEPNGGREFDNIQVTGLAIQQVPYIQTFDAGQPTQTDGWEYHSNSQGRIQVVGGRLRMDDTVTDYTYSLNEAILHVDLTNKTSVTLTLDQYSLVDENQAMSASFIGHENSDGIALSVDGINWIKVTDLTGSFTLKSFALDSIIALAKAAAGSEDVSDVRIKFQQYDNTAAPSDGREFDNIRITAVAVQEVPYNQNFDEGQPGKTDGWEYYSTNQGNIQVVAGRLRMDDSVTDYTYSLNEAVLHVNLTDKTNVVLTLDQYSLADENQTMSASFTGHYKADGIALSVDGVHWIKVTDLVNNFTGKSFALDSIIELAKTAAGSTNVSDVRIKFQQYDNTAAPSDGREFDNIKITADVAQAVPYTQDFSAGLPATAQGWEYYSDNQGQIQVVSGRLRMDDSVSDGSYSLNEAILHLDLTGKTNVTLTLDHNSLGDENNVMAASFTGHYKGDGIAISIDGINWVTVTNLKDSFTGQSFSLDSYIALAEAAAGNNDLSNVRIKFQQYDNEPSPNDGREFDNIQISAT